MSKFEDHLWREFVGEHGNALAQMSTSTAKPIWRGPRLVAGTSLGLAGVGAAVALVLGASATSPAFAVTRNSDGTVTISISRASGIAGANSRLRQLGIRAQVMQHAPAGFRCTSTVAQPGQGAPASERYIAKVHWTIDPRRVPAGRTLALTPPPSPPGGTGGNSGNSGNSGGGGNSGSRGGVWWSCGTEGPAAGSGPPPAPPGSGGNSGNS
jgi:hypothetical protein